MKKLIYTLALVFMLSLTACGGGDSEPQQVQFDLITPRHVVVSGDSITLQGGTRIFDHLKSSLPQGSTFENRGRNAQRALEMIEGTYGSLPELNKNSIYVFSFGTNEYLQGRPVQEYIDSIETILNLYRGYTVVLEAPWLVVNQGCSCNNIIEFREKLKQLGLKYNVPVVLENSKDNTDTIHLTGQHMDERAALVATTILGILK